VKGDHGRKIKAKEHYMQKKYEERYNFLFESSIFYF